jgi:hypothetical protein
MHENMLFLSHHQTYLDITMSIICFNTSFFPCQQPHTKIPFHLDTLKKNQTQFLKTKRLIIRPFFNIDLQCMQPFPGTGLH